MLSRASDTGIKTNDLGQSRGGDPGVTTNVTLHAGHDVAYFTCGQEAGGCAGAMSYYTAAGEPPGQWAGTAALKSLGLTGRSTPGCSTGCS